jgi:hypothetical protein
MLCGATSGTSAASTGMTFAARATVTATMAIVFVAGKIVPFMAATRMLSSTFGVATAMPTLSSHDETPSR